ncbi:MAG TPA: tagaturonate reductase, partial [Puia sp.]
LKIIPPGKVIVPDEKIFELPEKVLQFGTGMLLRGLPDYFIDKANRMDIFNGRVIIVKTTSRGDADVFDKQDGLYTLCVRGVEDGKKIGENSINSSISRVLNAQHEWKQILACAHNPDLQVIISNTTEIGIKLVNDDIRHQPPVSYPGKLLAFLYERFKAFNGRAQSGFVIVPTELIPDNGNKLQSIVLELAHINKLEEAFIGWVERCNYFCNSLVDRIVTGTPDAEIKAATEKELGYTDQLITFCEVYRLWAIEGDERIRKILSFCQADEGVRIEPDIDLYRELKLRLLNGTHTLSCGVAFLAGLDTVKEAMDDEMTGKYIAGLMQEEIGPSIPYEIEPAVWRLYITKVCDRFRNPHIKHYWINITLNYSYKIRMRCLPLLKNYYKNNGSVPERIALGFAAYLRFMKAVKQADNKYYGEFNGKSYIIDDETAGEFYAIWQEQSPDKLVADVLKNTALWGEDLSVLPGFQESVTGKLNSILRDGMRITMESAYQKNVLSGTS